MCVLRNDDYYDDENDDECNPRTVVRFSLAYPTLARVRELPKSMVCPIPFCVGVTVKRYREAPAAKRHPYSDYTG